jgi:Protein of unknown function (DUF1493)
MSKFGRELNESAEEAIITANAHAKPAAAQVEKLEASQSRTEVEQQIIRLISEFVGIPIEKITLESDLVKDLKIIGDDGDELIGAIDKNYKIDWTQLDVGAIFGNESYPLPWSLYPAKGNGGRYNCVMYEQVNVKVADIVEAVMLGKWMQEPSKLKLDQQRRYVLATSIVTNFPMLLVLAFVAIYSSTYIWKYFLRHN